MSNLFDDAESAESDRLYFAGCVRQTSPFSGAEYWLLPDGSRVDRDEAMAWLNRKESQSC